MSHQEDIVYAKAADKGMFYLRRNGDYSGLIPVIKASTNGREYIGRTMSASEIAELIQTLTRELQFVATRGSDH